MFKLINGAAVIAESTDPIIYSPEQHGWIMGNQVYQDGERIFVVEAVNPEAHIPKWEDAPAEYFWIDVGPFFDRFGQKALAVTSSTDPVVMGVVTLTIQRKYIDLKRADLAVLVGILKERGIINDEEMATVLTQRTLEQERHIKGLPQPAEA